MEYAAVFVAGVIAGAAIVLIANRSRQKDIEKSFSALSFHALRRNSEEFLKLANQTLSAQTQVGAGELEEKRKLIDQTLVGIKGELAKVEKSVAEFDGKREKAFGEINTKLQTVAEQTSRLQDTTGKLQLALANTKVRGQWGERIAEDILQLAGFIRGVNYEKQATQIGASRPDYTFPLPRGKKVNMDVKFPLDNYSKYINEETEPLKQNYKDQFLKDTRQRIKEVTTRDYIDPENNTVDYVLVFIPNEQVYCFINENDRAILDDALKNKVILCSPLTLYAILAVIKESMDNFNLEQTANQILSLLGIFYKQWGDFKKSMDRMGDRITKAYEEYQTLNSTRSRMLERPLRLIDDLRKQRGILEAPLVDEEVNLENGHEEGNGTKSPS